MTRTRSFGSGKIHRLTPLRSQELARMQTETTSAASAVFAANRAPERIRVGQISDGQILTVSCQITTIRFGAVTPVLRGDSLQGGVVLSGASTPQPRQHVPIDHPR
jgi:hypothetical protein